MLFFLDCFMSKFNQGLIEMDNIDQATELISYSHKNEVIIKGKKAEFSYSKSQSINQDVIKRNKIFKYVIFRFNI